MAHTNSVSDASYEFIGGYPSSATTDQARDDAYLARALVAYRFWYPTVSIEGIFNGNREIGFDDNKVMGIAATTPRQVGFTLNSDTPYGAAALDLSEGPMVVELPAGPYIGLVDDHNHRWITDLGIPGPDHGAGGKYAILPPDYSAPAPIDHHVSQSNSYKVLLAVRALPIGGDLDAAIAALSRVKIYRLGTDKLADVVDTSTRSMDSSCLRWEDNLEFWRVLHGILEEEPVVEEFRPMHGLLTTLGIGKRTSFAPGEHEAALLASAARQGRDQMLVTAFAGTRADQVAWNDRHWEWVGLVPDNADFETPAGIDLEARDRWFVQAIVASPAMFRRVEGSGSLYWLAARDNSGTYLDGGRDYTLTVPLPVPAKLFWSVTIYDAQTRSQVQTSQNKGALRSLFELSSEQNSTDEITLHFGPNKPMNSADTWLETVPGRGWFAYVRIYGPETAAFDGSWRPGDFTPAQ
ncbi:DUF1214 domain-containing protein [Rhodococcus sp. OK302]|uniref:DUF1214 domain-containing protein n=1 Tax=Rhodococcus sp. OK302 TaxID=1882769 RepID=UPI000B9426D1|nr:DUF1254 domain-containing protein [Rhodococcus sp. OK302]OYD69362.1 hypothetical protein BDB13_2927 [Rhodococcus sp. OK302]